MNENPITTSLTLSDVESKTIKSKAMLGIRALGLRTFLSVVLRVLSQLFSGNYLTQNDFGKFGLASNLAGISLYFTDVGLAGALIQQEAEITDDETTTIFWCQQILTGITCIVMTLAAYFFWRYLNASNDAYIAFLIILMSLFLSSLRIIPVLIMERSLRFENIARNETIENVSQAVGTIILILMGARMWALLGGHLIRGVVGLILVFMSTPWRPCGRFDISIALRLAKFGIPFQLNAILPVIGGSWATFIIQKVLGDYSLGLFAWAINISSLPILFNSIIIRIAYPTYSRLNKDPITFGRTLINSIRKLVALICLVFPIFITIIPVVITVCFRHRWDAAIILVQFLSFDACLFFINGTVCAAQNAIGRADERFYVTLVMLILRWLFGYIAVHFLGLIGASIAIICLTLIELFASAQLVEFRHMESVGIKKNIFYPIIITLFTTLPVVLISRYFFYSDFLLQGLFGSLLLIILLFLRERYTPWSILSEVVSNLSTILKKNGEK